MCMLHPGVVVNEGSNKDIEGGSHCNTTEATTPNHKNTPSPPEEPLSQKFLKLNPNPERTSAPGTHPDSMATEWGELYKSKLNLKPSVACAASKGVPHTSVLDCICGEIHASQQRMHEQREMHSTGADMQC